MDNLSLAFLVGFIVGNIFGSWAISYTKKEVEKHVGK
jgi:hypothetical protein